MNFTYTKENLMQLEEIENKLIFSHFDSRDALALGLVVVKNTEHYSEGVSVQIIR